jgi:cysteine sulfinate desulfinase/cysteine desulfurase-like protein
MGYQFIGRKHKSHENREAVLDASGKDVSAEIKAEKTKYTFTSRHQTAGQNRKLADAPFENKTKLEHLVTTATDQNCILEEIKSRLNSGNAF